MMVGMSALTGMVVVLQVYDANQGGLVARHSHPELMTAIPSRNDIHPTLPLLAAGTGSGRIHVYR